MNVYVFSDSRAGKSIHYLRRARIKLLNLRRAGQWILRRTKSQRPAFPLPADLDDPAGEHALAARVAGAPVSSH